jgi:hypothetical protein
MTHASRISREEGACVSSERSVVKAVRDYYNSPETVYKFSRWAPDPKRPGITAVHLGLDDVESFHRDSIRLPLDLWRHRKAVERMTRLIKVLAYRLQNSMIGPYLEEQ